MMNSNKIKLSRFLLLVLLFAASAISASALSWQKNSQETMNLDDVGNLVIQGNMTADNFFGNISYSYVQNAPWIEGTEADLNVNSSTYWDGETSQADLNVNSAVIALSWDGETSQANLNVNSSAYWDNLDEPSDLNNRITLDADNITNEPWVEGTEADLNVNSSTYWDGETSQANLNVNSSDYWDNLGSPSDIYAGDIADDDTYVRTSGDTITGDLVIEGNFTVIGEVLNATVTNQYLNGTFLPSIDSTFDIGSDSKKWDTIYVNTVNATTLDGSLDSSKIQNEYWIDSAGEATGALTSDLNIDSNTFVVSYDDDKVGIGTASPATKLDIDTGSDSAGIRIRGIAESTEIGDIYMDGSGAMVLDTTAGEDDAQYLDIRTEDNQFGVRIRESDGDGTSTYANLYVTDATDDYMSIGVNTVSHSAALTVTDSDRVGIGTATPSAKLDVEVSSGGAATIGNSGNVATGDYAVSMNYNTQATNIYALATGYGTTASGNASTAMGANTTASGDYATAMGANTTASGDYATAMGEYAKADADNTFAWGGEDCTSSTETCNNTDTNTFAIYGDLNVADINGNSKLFVNVSSGNIGVGTTTPQQDFVIVGDLNVTGSSYLDDVIVTADNITVNNIIPKDGGDVDIIGNLEIGDNLTWTSGGKIYHNGTELIIDY